MKYLANQNEKGVSCSCKLYQEKLFTLMMASSVCVQKGDCTSTSSSLTIEKSWSQFLSVDEPVERRISISVMMDAQSRLFWEECGVWTVTVSCLGSSWMRYQQRDGESSWLLSLLDTLGFLASFILLGRTIQQEMCQKSIGWDEPLPGELEPWWESWLEDLKNLKTSRFKDALLKRRQLHHFSDTSSHG